MRRMSEMPLRRLRRERGWSLRELAKRSGVGFTYISAVERGGVRKCGKLRGGDLTLRTAYKLARALDVPITEVFPEEVYGGE